MKMATSDAELGHITLHLAHRWFAFLEAPGGDLREHLKIFHPQVRLSGHRGAHLFAKDHETLISWFKAIPDEVSSHHIVHSTFKVVEGGLGKLRMVVAYQAPGPSGVHGSIISYETQIEFAPDGARFTHLDKTPILSNTREIYETSWAANRILARVHADLGGITGSDNRLRSALGEKVGQVTVQVSAPEGSGEYDAIITATGVETGLLTAMRLGIRDDVTSPLPEIETIEVITGTR